MDQQGQVPAAAGEQSKIDPMQLQMAMERLKSEQQLVPAILAGGAAALVGAVVWAAVTVFTGYQIGWMAVGVGFLVGFAVRYFGKGMDKSFGVVGAAWSLLGCGAGNFFAVCGMVAKEQGAPLSFVLGNLNVEIAIDMMVATFSPMDLLFYGIAVYEGYRFAFRRITEEELQGYLTGAAPIG